MKGALVVHGEVGVLLKEMRKGGERINGGVVDGGSVGAADLK